MASNLLSFICGNSNHTQKIIDVGKVQGTERVFTKQNLINATEYFIEYLLAMDVKAGDNIVLIANNSFETISIFCAIIDIGACVNIIPIKNCLSDIRILIDKILPKYIFCSHVYQQHEALLNYYFGKTLIYDSKSISNITGPRIISKDIHRTITPDAPVSVLFSSGTTNKPKGVVLPFKAFTNNSKQIGKHIKLSYDDKYLAVLPFSFIAGQITSIFAPLHFGSDVVICDSQNITKILGVINKYCITKTNIVPTLLYQALKLDSPEKYNVSSLKFVLSGGSECGPKLISEIRNRFGIKIIEGYGSTETGCGNCINDVDSPVEGSVGKLLPGHQIRFVVDKDNDKCIAIQSDSMMLRYYDNSNPLEDGWLITSDIGYLDEQNNLFIVGRKDDIIKCKGEKVYLTDIKKILLNHSSVHNAVVMGVDDEEYSKIPVAFVQFNEDIGENRKKEFLRWLNRRFNRVSKPDVMFVDEFPTTHSEKIDIQTLKRKYLNFRKGW
ncbi:MAG: fatty acid--CoA ligase family protein [Clostridia bacterium]|nr:fatty acid--CoA ligase family protein [Clostridia bacterium]